MVKNLPSSKWIPIFLSLSLVGNQFYTSESAIIQLSSGLAESHTRQVKVDESAVMSNLTLILLTTGEQIKFHQTTWQPSTNKWSLAGNSLVVNTTSSLLGLAKQNATFIELLGNNTYSRWLAEKAGNIKQNTAPSIVPGRPHTELEFASSNSGWRKPWITDVDYFVDKHFCRDLNEISPSDLRCLVIVWLDKSNKFVHYGSTYLKNVQELLNATSSHHRTKQLNLLEFPPIDVFKGIKTSEKSPGKIHGIVVDKRRSRLHVSFSDGSQPFANRILSGYFKNLKQSFRSSSHYNDIDTQLHQQALSSFNSDCVGPDWTPSEEGFKNLNVDETNGHWLFYLERSKGGKIFAFGLNNPALGADAASNLQELKKPTHALVLNLNNAETSDGVENATTMGMDVERQRLYWLTDTNALHSCNLAGSDYRKEGQLSSRPSIRSPSSIQIHESTLFISDPVKRSLITYSMLEDPKKATKSENIEVPNHEVLLVDMPTVMGFRVMTFLTMNLSPTPVEEEFDSTNIIENTPDGMEIMVSRRIGWNREVITFFTPPETSSKQRLKYDTELIKRTDSKVNCALKQVDPRRVIKEGNDKLLLFIIELSIVNTAILVWLVLRWVKRRLQQSSSNQLISGSVSDLCKDSL